MNWAKIFKIILKVITIIASSYGGAYTAMNV